MSRQLLLLMIGLFLTIFPAQAQDQCGVVTGISYPVDRGVFTLAQDFGVESPRHQGRYHTGEDLFGGRNASLGQPVRAIAAGLVTYSAPNGWGRDGGVVIIQHNFPDGSIAYSQYGHMQELNEYRFPPRYGCVKQGDIIGAVGNARPAPHVHFEIRINQPDVPGPGYSWEDPTVLGWRQPDRFVENWNAWLHSAHRWHLELTGDATLSAPPVILSDGSTAYLDGTRLRFATPDGRVLWRLNLERPALTVTEFEGVPLLTYPDGIMQRVNFDGSPGESWTTGTFLEGHSISAGDLLIFQTPGNMLVAFGADRKTIAWQLSDVPPVIRAYAAPNLIGLITEDHQLLSLSLDGRLLDTAQLQDEGSLTGALGGNLLAYTQGGLWRIDDSGTWGVALENAPSGGKNSAALESPDGALYVFTEAEQSLNAYGVGGTPLWQVALPDVIGRAGLALYDKVLLLTTDMGTITAVQAGDGAVCGTTHVYGDARSRLWQQLGADGILRVASAGSITGFDWQTFIGGCG